MAEKKFRSWVGFREEEERAPIANPVDRIRELESQLNDLRSRRDITSLSKEEFEILATETAMSMIKSAQARESKAQAAASRLVAETTRATKEELEAADAKARSILSGAETRGRKYIQAAESEAEDKIAQQREAQDVATRAAELSRNIAELGIVCSIVDAVWRQRLTAWLAFGERVVQVVAVLLGLGVLLVVGNTVRLDIGARSEEIAVLQHLLPLQAKGLQVAAVAGQHVALNVPEIEGRGHVLCQGLDKAQLLIERFLGLDPALQIDDPEQRQQEQQRSASYDFGDHQRVVAPGFAAHARR